MWTPPTGATPEKIEKSRGLKGTTVNKLLDKLKPHTSILFAPTIPDSFIGNINSSLNAAGFGTLMSVKPLTKKNRPRGFPPTRTKNAKYTDLNERKHSPGGSNYYVKGHLLNEKLGGPGSWVNLTPLSISGNTQHERRAESIVKRTVDLPAITEYVVTPNYSPRSDKGSLLTRIANSLEPADAKRVKSAIVEAEDWVPISLSIQAYILDESLQRRNTILNLPITNAVDRRYEGYYLSSSPRPVEVNLNTDDEATIATVLGIGLTLASRIVKVRDERRNSRFSSFEQISELVDGIGASRLRTLKEARHVQL